MKIIRNYLSINQNVWHSLPSINGKKISINAYCFFEELIYIYNYASNGLLDGHVEHIRYKNRYFCKVNNKFIKEIFSECIWYSDKIDIQELITELIKHNFIFICKKETKENEYFSFIPNANILYKLSYTE